MRNIQKLPQISFAKKICSCPHGLQQHYTQLFRQSSKIYLNYISASQNTKFFQNFYVRGLFCLTTSKILGLSVVFLLELYYGFPNTVREKGLNMKNAGYEILKMEIYHYGEKYIHSIALGYNDNPKCPSPFVTWDCYHNTEIDEFSFFTGHYYNSLQTAYVDYYQRLATECALNSKDYYSTLV